MADERDWVKIVAEGRCPECGLDAGNTARERLAFALSDEGAAWEALLMAQPETALRARAESDRWSALEYAAHVRDVLAVLDRRIERTVSETEPHFDWWDHEAAAVDERYNEQDPAEVAAALAGNARDFGTTLALLPAAAWLEAGTRADGVRFTVDAIARFALHEAFHHRHDAEQVLAR